MKAVISRRALLVVAAVLVLLVVAFVAGAWVGVDWGGSFCGYQVLPQASSNASLLHRELLYLDAGDTKALREAVDMELDGELLTICLLTKSPAGSSRDAVEAARPILRRIASYRKERPPSYSATYAAGLDASVARRLQDCLDEAAASPPPR
ncbi:MAG TPA: hypothetical protein VFP50_10555 [Anaeromyxobacteraceae bacterium]|nr:hypothetical protein [Anaeromyxobacteraceae bacterium]